MADEETVGVAVAEKVENKHPVRDGLLFLPASHRMHPTSHIEPLAVPFPAELYVSMIHVQLEHDELPAADIVLRGHWPEQDDDCSPKVSPKVLTGQRVQEEPVKELFG